VPQGRGCNGPDTGQTNFPPATGITYRSQALSPIEILRSATCNGAKLLGMQEVIGQIAEGFIADLLILCQNPLEDISVLADIDETCCGIIKEGRVVFSTSSSLGVDEAYF
jgi:imidazolonepropionase-like amidohydrolase